MIEEVLYPIVCKINEYLSNYILVFLLIGVGLWYSIRTRFVQVRCFGEAMKKTFGNLKLKGGAQKSGMTSFQALATAIAAQVGTGNIVGASGAILTGGPGAIFWMWVIAFFGMATIYAEATLAQKTRIIDKDGNVHGGPVYYITTAFKGGFGKFLAGFFAVAIILALGLMGSMVQSNSIGSTFNTAFGIPAWIMGVVLVIICAIIFLGGVQRLAAVTEKIVPIMAGIFLLGALVILVARIKYIPETFGMIFKYAFNPSAIIGGGLGYALKTAISQGAKRGLFSNEAGMGSTPHAHAQANVAHPHDQGVVAMIGVFIDTFVVLTLNALVIISTLYTEGGPLHGCGAAAAQDVLKKTNLAQTAFGVVFGESAGAISRRDMAFRREREASLSTSTSGSDFKTPRTSKRSIFVAILVFLFLVRLLLILGFVVILGILVFRIVILFRFIVLIIRIFLFGFLFFLVLIVHIDVFIVIKRKLVLRLNQRAEQSSDDRTGQPTDQRTGKSADQTTRLLVI